MKPLEGQVAIVAGATRGAGRGIAIELGAAGATVYCTGRSVRGSMSDMKRTETIDETAELVTAQGGRGIAVQIDHTDTDAVQSLFARIENEQDSRLDILVNDVWGGDPLTEWGVPFWQLDITKAKLLLERAVQTHLITSRYGVPLMLKHGRGLIIEVTDGDELSYRGNLVYDLAKTSVMRLALGMAEELKETGITALGLTPGFLRSEAMLDHFGVTEATWRKATIKDPHFAGSETPRYIGRAVVALATDPDVSAMAGNTLATWTLSDKYGFTDIDGSRPHWKRFFESRKEVSKNQDN